MHGRLAADPPPPLAALVPESTYYVTSTSKTLAPGLRVGFVAAPPGMAERLAATVRVTTWGAAPLTTEVVAGWIRDGVRGGHPEGAPGGGGGAPGPGARDARRRRAPACPRARTTCG